MIVIIDNYDSFTYNLYQALAVMVHEIEIIRNDVLSVAAIQVRKPDGIVISPGPGHPEQAGVCIPLIQQLGVRAQIPILGVCLGHQAIGVAFGASVVRAKMQLHGKDTKIYHHNGTLFKNIPSPFKAGRYHSLIVDKDTLPNTLTIDAEDEQGEIMALSHRTHHIYGVQFHPESILTPDGNQLLANFVNLCC